MMNRLTPQAAAGEAEEKHLMGRVEIQRALDQVLISPPFRNTQQCQNLLRYIVKHSLAGEDHLLRERVIGSEVFGRPPGYETSEDPVVRLRAADLRKRLAQFYQSVPDAGNVHIEIPSGCYRATFQWKSHPLSAGPGVEEPMVPVAVRPAEAPVAQVEARSAGEALKAPLLTSSPLTFRIRTWHFLAAAALAILMAAVILVVHYNRGPSAQFRAFWGPWTETPKPVIVSIGSNAVYRLSESITDQYARDHNLEAEGEEFFVPLAPDANIKGSDIHASYNSFVALGDVAAVSNIVASLTNQGKAFQERFPDDVSFAELHNMPSVLIGGFNNPMTLELTKHLGFVLRRRNEIDDLQDPKRRWLLRTSEDSHYTADYAILTRLLNEDGNAPLLSVAGLGQYGTLAAANFVCSPSAIFAVTRQLPKDWAKKNLQVVLRVQVVDFKPGVAEVVALRSW
jgi:hypothetical protein